MRRADERAGGGLGLVGGWRSGKSIGAGDNFNTFKNSMGCIEFDYVFWLKMNGNHD